MLRLFSYFFKDTWGTSCHKALLALALSNSDPLCIEQAAWTAARVNFNRWLTYPNCTSEVTLAYGLSSNPSEDYPSILLTMANTVRKDCYLVNRPYRARYIHIFPLQKGKSYTIKLMITTKQQQIPIIKETKITLSTDEQFNNNGPLITMNNEKCCK